MAVEILGEGPVPAVAMWIGEAPGPAERVTGRIWSGKAGALFDRALEAAGVVRAEQYITNLRKTHMAEGDDLFAEIGRLHTEFLTVRPKLIVTMGRNVTRLFLGDVDMETVHGLAYRASYTPPETGHWTWEGAVIPIYNPAAGLHDASLLGAVLTDMHAVADALDGRSHVRDLYTEVDKDYAWGFDPQVCRPGPIAIDTEGWYDSPWCLSYSWKKGTARVIRATDADALADFQTYLDTWNPIIVMHNALHDLKVLRAMGLRINPARIRDTMMYAHVLQTEPKGLKALSARHLGRRMTSYRDLTFATDQEIAFAYLQQVALGTWPKPDPIYKEDEGGNPKVTRPRPVQSRAVQLCKKFNAGTDEHLRTLWDNIEESVREPAEKDLGPMPTFTLSDIDETAALMYAGEDADATLELEGVLMDMLEDRELAEVALHDCESIPVLHRIETTGLPANPEKLRGLSTYFTDRMKQERASIASYNGGADVNPSSRDQVAELLFTRLRLPVIRLTPGRQPSTDDKTLETLRPRHAAVGHICDYREFANLRNNFADKLAEQAEKGRVIGQVKPTTVPSGRIAMTDPNLLGIPTRSEEGARIRSAFEAPPGYVFASCDLNQIELRVMASMSKDPLLCQQFRDGIDVHKQSASNFFGVPIEQVTKLQRDSTKTAAYGILYGITGEGLTEQFHRMGIFNLSGQDVINGWFDIYRGVRTFVYQTHDEAEQNGFVRTLDGRIRYLPAAVIGDERARTEAFRHAVSHKIQGSAAWLMRRAQNRVYDTLADAPFAEILLQIHDELLFLCQEDQQELLSTLVLTDMQWDSLMKLDVPIVAKMGFGATWGDCK